MLREERSFLAFSFVPAQTGKQAKLLVSLCAKEPLQVSRASKPSIHWSWIRSLHAAALGEMVFFAGLLLRKSVFETSSFTLWQQLTFWLLSMFSVCELALLALPHTNENVFTNGNSFSLYFVLAQEPQTTVIHNPDGNKVFRKNQLHLAFPHHTFRPLFHNKIGPFQEFITENLIPAFVTPGVCWACFHVCSPATCVPLVALGGVGGDGRAESPAQPGLGSPVFRFSQKCCSLNKTKERCSQSVVRLYWEVLCAVVTLDTDVISVYPICCFSACLYTVLWRVVCTGLWFSSIASLSLKKSNILNYKEVFWFSCFLHAFFLFLVDCDGCIWQLIPKMCFVLFFSCMDLKRDGKYHHLHITYVPRFPGNNLLSNKKFTV